jgi:hypothetical protein
MPYADVQIHQTITDYQAKSNRGSSEPEYHRVCLAGLPDIFQLVSTTLFFSRRWLAGNSTHRSCRSGVGPFINFLIFDLRKRRREIVFDLMVIAMIQFGALAYGIALTYTQRPVAIVVIDEFVVGTTMKHYGGKPESTDQLKQYSDEKPPIIFADLPLDKEVLAEVHRIKFEEKILDHAQMQLYKTRTELAAALKSNQLMYMSRLDHYKHRDRYEAWLKQQGKPEDEILIARFDGRYGTVWLVFDLDGRYINYF